MMSKGVTLNITDLIPGNKNEELFPNELNNSQFKEVFTPPNH